MDGPDLAAAEIAQVEHAVRNRLSLSEYVKDFVAGKPFGGHIHVVSLGNDSHGQSLKWPARTTYCSKADSRAAACTWGGTSMWILAETVLLGGLCKRLPEPHVAAKADRSMATSTPNVLTKCQVNTCLLVTDTFQHSAAVLTRQTPKQHTVIYLTHGP
jgi:hypothetical protein